MTNKNMKSAVSKSLAILALLVILTVTAVTGCTAAAGTNGFQDSSDPAVSQVEVVEGSEGAGEHGSTGEGSETGGEHGNAGEGSEAVGEHGRAGEGSETGHSEAAGHEEGAEGGSSELNEAAMSSPIMPLDQSWNGVLGDLEVSMQYDAAAESVFGTVKNISNQKLCYVQAEPHLKLGQQTVGELGPDKLGDLTPGQQVNSSLSVTGEPGLAGVAYDGYVIHMELFDCSSSGPILHAGGEGAEGGSEGAGGEGHGPGGESGSETGGEVGKGGSAADSEEGSGANALALNETYDVVRNGARLIIIYDAQYNTFVGALENTTNAPLEQVRVEVHLSNGTELGPTTPVDLAPGEQIGVMLPATSQPFDSWTPHAEVGRNEHGAASEGSETSGEHGSSSEGNEAGGEHGGAGESGGEHGGGSEGGGG